MHYCRTDMAYTHKKRINRLCNEFTIYRAMELCFHKMSVCPSVSRRYSIETANHIIKLFTVG